MENNQWYALHEVSAIATPTLLVYSQRVQENITKLLAMAGGDTSRLRPHIKTCKSPDAIKAMMQAGLSKFKCATIAEAELLGICGATDVLIAYQPVGANIKRLIQLIKQYPETAYACLVDNFSLAQDLEQVAIKNRLTIKVYIDVNVGMNRTGIAPDYLWELLIGCSSLTHLALIGIHCYDGHIHDHSLDDRRAKCEAYFLPILSITEKYAKDYGQELTIVIGGTPTFPIHIERSEKNIECSPGTFVYWDYGYQNLCAEQPFLTAALVLSRVISLPSKNKICVDLGHKAVAAENELAKRVLFLNAPEAKPVAQSEEHLVLDVGQNHSYQVGDFLYGLPYHICPTVALYEEALEVIDHQARGLWKIPARKRKINI
ncbi:D-TA family PLP-dependent enzyme [Olivibacter sp. SDN3]|uniref:D-TA family PLP-dependent enzyme n=1 Tax=Olivibacter sp. SDN3 TaxID=2764720 RepID=UPI001650E0E8|nr:D-TA family PLP-dependent enzyme [Olivibacter sp. SDN3]QNL49271.1 D-TA family PLP-dependent enzyme [Olivibacter sp. SDN3]